MSRLVLLWMMILLIQGCADVAMSGAQAVYNRHSIQKSVNDNYNTFRANQALNEESKTFKNTNITVATYNDEMLLTGQVPYAWQRERAEQIIKKVTDVGKLHNVIAISSPSSSLTRMSDAWITAKVKSKMLASDDVDASQVKVITENGTVYLMGIIQPDEADAAVELASDTDGVRSVVKIFRYIHISNTKNV